MRWTLWPLAAAIAAVSGQPVWASPPPGSHTAPQVAGGEAGGVRVTRVVMPSEEEEKAYAAAQRERRAIEKELKKIRAKYFRAARSTEMRQVGIMELRKFDDPAVYPLLLELFEREDREVRKAILDHFVDLGRDEADATIAWGAVFDRDKRYRADSRAALEKRAAEVGVSDRVKSVVAAGLRSEKTDHVVAAAELAHILKIYEAIPALINAQVVGGGGGSQEDGALAYILVGSQVAFVSDLEPVVGDSAVAFDPTVSVATEGVILRVIDAYVVTYRVEVHRALTGLASSGWGGRPTEQFGWDQAKWREWYVKEFLPYRAEAAAAGKK